ncbi:MAG: hypothetical protein U5K75_00150 [Ahrensia sp.]|nr:hypothetical protein [Ahrensia sp.]
MIRDLPLPQGDAMVRKLAADMPNAPTNEDIVHLEFAQKALAQKRTALNTDLIGYGEKAGIVPRRRKAWAMLRPWTT